MKFIEAEEIVAFYMLGAQQTKVPKQDLDNFYGYICAKFEKVKGVNPVLLYSDFYLEKLCKQKQFQMDGENICFSPNTDSASTNSAGNNLANTKAATANLANTKATSTTDTNLTNSNSGTKKQAFADLKQIVEQSPKLFRTHMSKFTQQYMQENCIQPKEKFSLEKYLYLDQPDKTLSDYATMSVKWREK